MFAHNYKSRVVTDLKSQKLCSHIIKQYQMFVKLLLTCLLLGQIQSCKPGCAGCDFTTFLCYECSNPSNQILSDGSCAPVNAVISNCLIYSQGSGCTKCAMNYVLQAGICVQDRSGCLIFQDNGTCLNCAFGTFIMQGRCTGVVNCEGYPPGVFNICQRCALGYNLMNGLCISAEGCSSMTNGVCQSCAPGFTYSGYSCVRISRTIRGCIVYSISGAVCQICRDGFIVSSGQCMFQGFTAQSFTSTTVSSTGQSTSSSIINPTPSTNSVSVTNTTVVSTASEVSQVPSPFVTSQSTSFSSGGSTFGGGSSFGGGGNFNGGGSNGASASSVNFSGVAVSNGSGNATATTVSSTTVTVNRPLPPNCDRADEAGNCLRCTQGFYRINGSCQAASPLCNGVDFSTGACLGCISGYVLSNGTCTVAPAPIPTPPPVPLSGTMTVVQIDTTVVTIDTNCAVPQGNICTSCNAGYSLNSGRCVAVNNPDPNCLRYANFFCIACVSPLTLSSNSQCVIEFCQILTAQRTCGQCISGYNLSSQGTACVRIVTIANCDSISNGTCVRCSLGYYLNNNGQCVQAFTNCSVYNPFNGLCLSCPPLFTLAPDSYCMQTTCRVSNRGICIQCIQAYFLDTLTASCRQINIPNCTSVSNGVCVGCANGFSLVNNLCVVVILNCQQYAGNGSCVSCNQGFQLINGGCLSVPQNCQNVGANGFCAVCVQGFTLTTTGAGGFTQCVQTISIPNCLVTGPSGCLNCSNRFWLTQTGNCQQVNSLCNDYNQTTGVCLSCYGGYTLNAAAGICSLSVASDRNCRLIGSDGQCAGCYPSYYLNINKQCTLINQNCRTFDATTNQCTECYGGYTLRNGSCIQRLSDTFCRAFNTNGSCKQCSQGFYLMGERCIRFNTNCYIVNPDNGNCTSCYQGWVLTNGDCVKGTTVELANCNQAGPNGECAICSSGYYKNRANRTCVIINSLCKNADNETGWCTSCFAGYALTAAGNCEITSGVKNCRSWNGPTCLECSSGFYLQNNQCLQISTLCKTANQTTGACLTCFHGYALQGVACIPFSGDLNCRQSQNGVCIACSKGFLMRNGSCTKTSDLCRTADSNGLCTSCYGGYTLVSGDCMVPTNNDPNCNQKSGAICLNCMDRYYLLNNVCTKLTRNCVIYDPSTGFCMSCPVNTRLQNGDCLSSPIASDIQCIASDGFGKCTKCNYGYFVKAGVCTQVNTLCVDFDYDLSVCKECQPQNVLQDGDCMMLAMALDPNCARYSGGFCSVCKSGFLMSSFVCITVDTNCLDFDQVFAQCRRCRIGRPQGAVCVM